MIISYWLKGIYLVPSQELLYRMKFFCEEIARLKPPEHYWTEHSVCIVL
jgi:hypothetical protein